MNLTDIIRKLETQLKNTEKLAKSYDTQANALRNKLASIATIVGQKIAAQIAPKNTVASSGGGHMSAEGRARIIAAQRKRWAEFRARSGRKGAGKSTTPKGRAKLSAAGRARIIAAQRKRWAKFRKKNK